MNRYGDPLQPQMIVHATYINGRIASLLQGSFAKETYNFVDPTNERHPIPEIPNRFSKQDHETCGYYRSLLQKSPIKETLFCRLYVQHELSKQDQATRWRRPIGCLKLQVIFRKRAINYWALLRKTTYEDKASYDSTPPSSTRNPLLSLVQTIPFHYFQLIFSNNISK